MQIKVTQCADREEATVEVINPSTEEVLSCTELANGQSVVVTAVNAHEASDIEVGEVQTPEVNSGGDSSEEDESEADSF